MLFLVAHCGPCQVSVSENTIRIGFYDDSKEQKNYIGEFLRVRFWPTWMVRFWPKFGAKRKGQIKPEPNNKNSSRSKITKSFPTPVISSNINLLEPLTLGQKLKSRQFIYTYMHACIHMHARELVDCPPFLSWELVGCPPFLRAGRGWSLKIVDHLSSMRKTFFTTTGQS